MCTCWYVRKRYWWTWCHNCWSSIYLRAMIAQFDNSSVNSKDVTKDFTTISAIPMAWLVSMESEKWLNSNNEREFFMVCWRLRSKSRRERGLLNDSYLVLSWDGGVSPVVMHNHFDAKLYSHVCKVRRLYTQKFWAGKTRKSFNFF